MYLINIFKDIFSIRCMLLQTNLRPNGEHIEIDESSFSGQRQVDMIYYQKFYHDSCINFDESWPNYKTKLLNMCGLCFTSTTFNIHTQRERGDNITCRWPCCVYATKYIFEGGKTTNIKREKPWLDYVTCFHILR